MWCGLWVPHAQYTLNKLYVNGEDFHQEWYWYMEINKQAFSILFVKVSSLRFFQFKCFQREKCHNMWLKQIWRCNTKSERCMQQGGWSGLRWGDRVQRQERILSIHTIHPNNEADSDQNFHVGVRYYYHWVAVAVYKVTGTGREEFMKYLYFVFIFQSCSFVSRLLLNL